MFRPYIRALDNLEPRGIEPGKQLRPRPQSQVLREIRKDQPALAPWLQMRRQRTEEAAQHLTPGVVDATLDGRTRPRRNPGRIADHERRPPFRVQIRVEYLHALQQPETL